MRCPIVALVEDLNLKWHPAVRSSNIKTVDESVPAPGTKAPLVFLRSMDNIVPDCNLRHAHRPVIFSAIRELSAVIRHIFPERAGLHVQSFRICATHCADVALQSFPLRPLSPPMTQFFPLNAIRVIFIMTFLISPPSTPHS